MRSFQFHTLVRAGALVVASGLFLACAATPVAPPAAETPAVAAAVDRSSWVAFSSPHDVPTTVARLEATIAARGAVHFTSIDHAAGARSVDLPLAPTTLVIFGNPKVGSKLMAADPRIGSELPLRVLVWQAADGSTQVGFTTPLALAARFELGESASLLAAMDKAMRTLVETAIAPE